VCQFARCTLRALVEASRPAGSMTFSARDRGARAEHHSRAADDCVIVTHNTVPAHRIADRTMILEAGKLVTIGPTKEVLRDP